MAKQSVKNTGAQEQVEGKFDDLPDFSSWTEHQIGFAPYWKVKSKGDWIYMKILAKDARNPKFVRYLCEALMETPCRRGPANDDVEQGATGEPVTVKKGDCFSISVWKQLEEEFDFFLYAKDKAGLDVPCRLEAKTKTKTQHPDGNRMVWNWSLKSDPVERPKLELHRGDFNKEMLALREAKNEETDREQLPE